MVLKQFFSNAVTFLTDLNISWPVVIGILALVATLIALGITIKLFSCSEYPHSKTTMLASKEDKIPIILDNILTRRTISPKDCLENRSLDKRELETILEASNWAPTHNKTEPWRYIIFQGPQAITSYLDFLDDFYRSLSHSLSDKEMEKFNKKMSGARKEWPAKCSALVVIAMKRQQPDENGNRMPEWEEICAVAMSVQNMHLMASSFGDLAGFWSSHTWCKRARDSEEMREYLNLTSEEDRVFGAFLIGRYDPKKRFRSSRKPIADKVQYRNA